MKKKKQNSVNIVYSAMRYKDTQTSRYNLTVKIILLDQSTYSGIHKNSVHFPFLMFNLILLYYYILCKYDFSCIFVA